jgi:hypothetical protein
LYKGTGRKSKLTIYFNHSAMLEPAKYDNRKKLDRNAGKKYVEGSTELVLQGLAKGGCRWHGTCSS